jgi:hypothetical protein
MPNLPPAPDRGRHIAETNRSAIRALRFALGQLVDAAPQERDYTPEAFAQAGVEHDARVRMLRLVLVELDEITTRVFYAIVTDDIGPDAAA